jgi:hypothetical protein
LLIAQTFTIDLNAVAGAQQVNISSIDVFFKQKPYKVGNISGVVEPGINAYIVPTAAGGIPNYKTLDDYAVSRKEYSEIISSIDATQVTNFKFSNPITVQTGQEYAIVLKADNDEEFELWAATQGETNVDNKTVSVGLAGKYVGRYFELSNQAVTWQALPYKSLKFAVYTAKYSGAQPNIDLYIGNYEYVTFNEIASSGSFIGGEMVFQDKSTADGTASVVKGQSYITTSGGAFNIFSASGDPCFIVLKDYTSGTSFTPNVRRVIDVSNDFNTITVDTPFNITNTAASFIKAPVATAYVTKRSKLVDNSDNLIILSDSTANSTLHFTNNSILVGEISGTTISNAYFNDILVHFSEPHVYVHTPSGTSFTATQIFDYTTTDNVTGTTFSGGELNYPVSMYSPTNLDVGAPVMLKSRSTEVVYKGFSTANNSLSSRLQLTVTNNSDYVSPQVDYNATDVFFTRYIINNDATNENTNSGNAYSKHVSTKISFGNNRQAEDVLIYLDAYKPAGTNINVYAKLYNSSDSDYFDDKDWTLLKETSGNRNSSMNNLNDYVEYTYSLYSYPQTLFTANGSVAVSAGSATVTGTGTFFNNTTTVGGFTINGNSNQLITNSSITGITTGMLVTGSGIPGNTFVSTVTTGSPNNTIAISRNATVGSSNTSLTFSFVGASGILPGDLVKIYQPLFPETYIIAPVTAVANSTSMTLATAITSADVSRVGSSAPMIDKLKYSFQAFQNKSNNNTVRYYNSNLAPFDKYDTFALKIVFLSNSQFTIPKVKDIRAIGVSA